MASMIDWVTASVPCQIEGRINDGEVVCVKRDGEVEWSSERRLKLEGSYSSTIAVRGGGSGEGGTLEISGNPSKFLQGHNLFGSNDVQGLMCRTLEVVSSRLQLQPAADDVERWRAGGYNVTRVDIARMHDLGSPERVTQFLGAALHVAKGKYQRASGVGTTVYIGEGSRRVQWRFYDKMAEIQASKHQLPEGIPERGKLLEFARGKLRQELQLGSRELRDKQLRTAASWSADVVERVFDERAGGIELNDTMRLSDEVSDRLPPRLFGPYWAWRGGKDLRQEYSRTHFYRLRSQLLAYGIDIAHVRPREVVANTQYLLGAPLRSFIGGPGVPVPEWAYGAGLVAA